jgi:hypothetical protein
MTRLCSFALAIAVALPAAAVAGPAPVKPAPAKAAPSYKVDVVKLTAQPALVRRVRAKPAELEAQLKPAILAMLGEATRAGLDLAGPPYVRYHARGEVWDVEAGVPVVKAPAAAPSAETQIGGLPAGEAATLLHAGPHKELPAAHDVLTRWTTANGRKAAGGSWEVFLTNPLTTPNPAAQRTKVFLPLEAAAKGAAK